ncbi:MAG: hypothetical protein LBQ77_07635 [Treponema sp.]|nr:hypothetical protein [Treponema sp.]
MNVIFRCSIGQIFLFLFCLSACTRSLSLPTLELSPTYPLSRTAVGYGVILASYANVVEQPGEAPVRYLRRGSSVKLSERRTLVTQNSTELWLEIEDGGWIREDAVALYDSEEQMQTAVKLLDY